MKQALILIVLSVLSLVALNAEADQQVRVTMTDGDELVAEFDERTDESHLWLRFNGETTTVLRPIAWKRVAAVTRTVIGASTRLSVKIDTIGQQAPPTFAQMAHEALFADGDSAPPSH